MEPNCCIYALKLIRKHGSFQNAHDISPDVIAEHTEKPVDQMTEKNGKNYTFPHQGKCAEEMDIPKGVEKDFMTPALNINAFIGIINSTLYLAAVKGHRETNKKNKNDINANPEQIKLSVL